MKDNIKCGIGIQNSDSMSTLLLVFFSAFSAIKGYIWLSYSILICVFLVSLFEMIYECMRETYSIGEDYSQFIGADWEKSLLVFSVIAAMSVIASGVFKNEDILISLVCGTCIVVGCKPYGISYIHKILYRKFLSELDRLNCKMSEATSIFKFVELEKIYIDSECLFSEKDTIVSEVFTIDVSAEVTGGAADIYGQFYENGRAVRIQNSRALKKLLDIGVLCNNASLKRNISYSNKKKLLFSYGDCVERALLTVAAKAGRFADNIDYMRVIKAENIGETSLRYSITENANGEKEVVVLGNPNEILPHCSFIFEQDKTDILTQQQREYFLDCSKRFLQKGKKTILAAFTKSENYKFNKDDLSGLTLVGGFAINSSVSRKAYSAIEALKAQGIEPIIISEYGNKIDNNSVELFDVNKITNKEAEKVTPKCEYFAGKGTGKLRITFGEEKSDEIIVYNNDISALPKLTHFARKLRVNQYYTGLSLFSEAIILCLSAIFLTTVGIPVTAMPVYIMNYFLITSLILILQTLAPISEIKNIGRNFIEEELFTCVCRSGLTAIASAEVFMQTLKLFGSNAAFTACFDVIMLSQVLFITKKLTNLKGFAFSILIKTLVCISVITIMQALFSTDLLSNLFGMCVLSPLCITTIVAVVMIIDLIAVPQKKNSL